jgi:toxin FitB
MSSVVLLDAGPLGMYANPKSRKPKTQVCKQRVEALLASGIYVKAPEIADYEIRRKLLHLTLRDPKCKAIERLDAVVVALGLVRFAADTMKRAAGL